MNNSKNTNPGNTNWSLRVDGKTALVTGAAGGLGHSFTRCLLEAARRLSAINQGGSIIMISSILGHRVAGNVAPYAAAKAGVEQ